MRVDLTCPVEMWHCGLPNEKYPVCTMQMYNLSDKSVSSLQVCVRAYDNAGQLRSRKVERVQVDDVGPQTVFEVLVADEEAATAPDLEIRIEKVWFTDGTVWRSGAASLSEYDPPPALSGARMEAMRYLAGPDANCFPSDQGAVWVCVCSRPNPASAGTSMMFSPSSTRPRWRS